MHPFYLFLDFDGVLHRVGESPRFFEHAARLGALLAGHPEVELIVSSSWRTAHTLDELREMCGSVLGRRLVGVTPSIVMKRVIDQDPPYSRFVEVASWLAGELAQTSGWIEMESSVLARDDWLAIDDNEAWFPPGCRQLLHVFGGTGMQDPHFAELEARLQAAQGKARMSPELELRLKTKYPGLLQWPREDAGRSTACAYGILCGNGWGSIIDDLCGALQAGADAGRFPQPVISQITQEAGRIRVQGANVRTEGRTEVDAFRKAAEERSATACEICSAPAVLRWQNGVQTVCDAHATPGSRVVQEGDFERIEAARRAAREAKGQTRDP